MPLLVQTPAKDLRMSRMNRTSRSATLEAISSSRRCYLRSPDELEGIRPDFDMEHPLDLSLEMRVEVGSISVKGDHLCFRCWRT